MRNDLRAGVVRYLAEHPEEIEGILLEAGTSSRPAGGFFRFEVGADDRVCARRARPDEETAAPGTTQERGEGLDVEVPAGPGQPPVR